jgi:hypothetical protein
MPLAAPLGHRQPKNNVFFGGFWQNFHSIGRLTYINYVIGMNNPVQDGAAIEFAKGFYDGLGYKISGNQDVFQRAFDEGIVAIEMENLSQGSIPVLKKR